MLNEKISVGLLAVIALVGVLFVNLGGAATPLDPTFGENGLALQNFGIGDDEIYAMAEQADGKIIVAGYSENGAVKSFAIVRFLENGTADPDFNNNGLFTHSMGNGDSIGHSILIQEDGKIILAGSTDDGHKISVIRLTSDGFLDSSFAADGQLLLAVDDGEMKNCKIDVASDGTIVVAGTIERVSTLNDGFFVRFKSDGELDENFGQDGIIFLKQPYDTKVNTIALLPDGKILAGGSFTKSGVMEAGLLQLGPEGVISGSYGTGGEVVLAMEGTGAKINDLLLEQDGNVIITGSVNNGAYRQAFVGKVDENGTSVTDFGTSGFYVSPIESENVANVVALQNDGSILLAGSVTDSGGAKDVLIMVIGETAEMLTSAYTVTDIAGQDDVGYALSILPDGRILAAGSAGNSNDKDFAVLRYDGNYIMYSSERYAGTAIVTEGFSIFTTPVTEITRVSAVSGGIISDDDTFSCETSCEIECGIPIEQDGDDTLCYDICLPVCEARTVKLRGICFGVEPNPEYDVGETSDDEVSPAADDPTASPISSSPYTGTLFSYDIIRSGQTEDGSDTGEYKSEIEVVSPDVKYYARAYAVLSDDKVIYGNQVMFKTNDACFIATAAYGSLLEKHVVILRDFRDRYMKGNKLGEQLIVTYYRFSPQIAGAVEQNAFLAAMVRMVLLPIVFVAWFIVKTTLTTKIWFLAGLVGLGLWGMKKNQVIPT